MQRRILLASLLMSLYGCQGRPTMKPQPTNLTLAEDEAVVRQEILKLIPVGSSVAVAENVMAQNGFECSMQRDKDGHYLYCDRKKSKDAFVGTRWQVLLHYADDSVTDVSVSVGFVGP